MTLKRNDYVVREAVDAKEGIRSAVSHSPDLILLDIGLPDESGLVVLKKLREWYDRPVIILSVLNAETDIVTALDNGANDYLTKPFRIGELLARIRTAMRNSVIEESQIIDCNDLRIDLTHRKVTLNNEVMKLTSTEYALLALFAKNDGKVMTHQYLLKQIWGPTFTEESQYIRVYIAQLRKKIEVNPNRPIHLITESGVGYRFVSKK
jgi:two-component system KDP operon response regulator KdpE